MTTKHFLKGVGLVILLMFTTGVALPWVISNFVMPIWMILGTVGAIIVVWGMLLQPIYTQMIKMIFSPKNNGNKDEENDRSN